MLTLCTLKTFLAKHSGATECISLISVLPLHAFNKFQANYVTWKRLRTFSRFKVVFNFCFKITNTQPFLSRFPCETARKTGKLEWRIFHKRIIIITFSKLFAALLITEQLLIKANYQAALPHSNNLVLLFCSAWCHNLPHSFMKGKAPRKEHLVRRFYFNSSERRTKRAKVLFFIGNSALRRRAIINNLILLADRNMSPHKT